MSNSFDNFALVWDDFVNSEVVPSVSATADYLSDNGISIDVERLDAFEKKAHDEMFAISKLVPLMMELQRGYDANLDLISRIRLEQEAITSVDY